MNTPMHPTLQTRFTQRFELTTPIALAPMALASGGAFLRIHGQDVPVKAEVVSLSSASAHADRQQLLGWLQSMKQAPGQVYVVHGERGASDALRKDIEHQLKWRALVPEHGSTWPA